MTPQNLNNCLLQKVIQIFKKKGKTGRD